MKKIMKNKANKIKIIIIIKILQILIKKNNKKIYKKMFLIQFNPKFLNQSMMILKINILIISSFFQIKLEIKNKN